MATANEQLRKVILGRHPLVYVRTWEEERAVRMLEALAQSVYGERGTVWSWSCVQGLSASGATHLAAGDTTDPLQAIRAVLDATEAEPPSRGFAIFRDLPPHFERPDVVRALREAYERLRARDSFLFVVSPQIALPELLCSPRRPSWSTSSCPTRTSWRRGSARSTSSSPTSPSIRSCSTRSRSVCEG